MDPELHLQDEACSESDVISDGFSDTWSDFYDDEWTAHGRDAAAAAAATEAWHNEHGEAGADLAGMMQAHMMRKCLTPHHTSHKPCR